MITLLSSDVYGVNVPYQVAMPTLVHASGNNIMVKRQKAVYRLVSAPQGGTQKYTLAFAYDSPR